MALKRRKKTEHIIKLNPYLESKDMALKLLASLSSHSKKSDVRKIFKEVLEYLRGDFFSCMDDYNYYREYKEIEKLIENQISILEVTNKKEYINIAVAGGFSAGKSTFLNTILNIESLLPTGLQPTSVVPTYLYCDENAKSLKVLGETVGKAKVELNTDVVDAIGHDFERRHNAQLASVLDKIIITIPNTAYNGISFIDTPGYSKGEDDDVRGKTDKESARNSLLLSDALMWLIDIETGAINREDLDFIKDYNKPVVIIFTKADRKPLSEIKSIIATAKFTLNKNNLKVLDIVAFNSFDNEVVFSLNGMSFIEKIKGSCKSLGDKIGFIGNIDKIKTFIIEDIESDRLELKEIIKDNNRTLINIDRNRFDYDSACKDINNLKDYSINIVGDSSYLSDLGLIFKDIAYSSLERELVWNEKSGIFSDTESLLSDRSENCDSYNEFYEEIDRVANERSLDEKDMNALESEIGDIASRSLAYLKDYNEYEKNYEEWYRNNIKESRGNYKRKSDDIAFIEDLFMKLESKIKKALKHLCNQSEEVLKIAEEKIEKDVFKAIDSNNIEVFIKSCCQDLDLMKKNAKGYTPLTYAVSKGQNDMVSFLLNQNANVRDIDGRGFNCFQTAVENQYKDICELIIEKDSDIINTSSLTGLSVLEIAKQNQEILTKWLEGQSNRMN